MTSARLLAVAILCCPLSLFAQSVTKNNDSANSALASNMAESSVPAQSRFELDQAISLSRDGEFPADRVCLTIRSYVVARDSKNSDSVHLVRSSTCQMSNLYHLKTTHTDADVLRPVTTP